MTPLTREDIELIRDYPQALAPTSTEAAVIRDLATTALELERKLGEVTDDWRHCCAAEKAAEARIQELLADNANAGGSIDDLQARLRAAEARIRDLETQVAYEQERNTNNVAMADMRIAALEEGLRGLSEAVISSVHDGTHGDIPARECHHVACRRAGQARALLTEQKENTNA